MLPSDRVIGHKEYGNTPPGGWKGRKSDPVYDMNWRRNRVANFQPAGGDMLTKEDVYYQVMAALRNWRDGGKPDRNLLELVGQVRNDIYHTQGGILAALGQTDEQVAAALKPLLTDIATTVAATVAAAAAAAAKTGGGVTEEQARQIAVEAVAAKLTGS